ncbi:MAG: hypothetical protein Q4C29_01210 [bacterium]|nr:hypothetical protein [bacterium]
MLEKMNDVLLQSILLEDNATIKSGEGLEDFLNSFDEEKLFKFIAPYASMEVSDKNDANYFDEISKSKEKLVNYITDNFKDILEFYVTVFEKDELEFVKELASKSGNITFSIHKPKVSLKFVLFMKEFAFSKVYFDETSEKVTIFIPSEYADSLRKSLNNKDVLERNKIFNNVCDAVIGMASAYAVIPFEDMYDMLKEFFDLSEEEVLFIVEIKSLIDEVINVNFYKDTVYVSSIEFPTEEDAYSFYKGTKGKYRKFSQEELIALRNDSYLEMLPSYKNFYNYLNDNYDIKDDASFEICKIFLIEDFLVGAQYDEKNTKEQFMRDIDEFFIMNETEKKEAYRLMHLVYDDYPKWIKRGNK